MVSEEITQTEAENTELKFSFVTYKRQ
jgi:hypothetical protein